MILSSTWIDPLQSFKLGNYYRMDPPGPFVTSTSLLGALSTLSPRTFFPRLRATFVQANPFLLGPVSPMSVSLE
jgi:hypothetical protein